MTAVELAEIYEIHEKSAIIFKIFPQLTPEFTVKRKCQTLITPSKRPKDMFERTRKLDVETTVAMA
ncbi:hypothetical protein L484_016337 [Morus notabilis]|uniref:Uncharacterized protein n=1 Tax=Morus notabilis TaxID=981085 RepID=W9QE88_9ROSA|nr:hypothetical protein L484_016337 [Morus notabilis]